LAPAVQHCTNCGGEISPGGKFCPTCGTAVGSGEAPPAQ
jgi:hypothetical protein